VAALITLPHLSHSAGAPGAGVGQAGAVREADRALAEDAGDILETLKATGGKLRIGYSRRAAG